MKLFCVSDAFMGIVGCLEQWVGEVLAQGAVIPLAPSSVQGAILGIKAEQPCFCCADTGRTQRSMVTASCTSGLSDSPATVTWSETDLGSHMVDSFPEYSFDE